MKHLRIALAQINTTVGDLKGNARLISSSMQIARRQRADFICFPELTLTGYPPEDLLFKPSFVDENLKTLKRVAKTTRGITAFVGFVDRDKRGLYNAAAVLSKGAVQAVYRKLCLPNYGVFDEKRYFKPGSHVVVLKHEEMRVGLSICEDIWPHSSQLLHSMAGQKLDVLINLSASPYHYGKARERQQLFKKRAKRLNAYLIYTNLVGGQDELVFDGSSCVFNRAGKVIQNSHAFAEDLTFCDIERPMRNRAISKPKVKPGQLRSREVRLPKLQVFPKPPLDSHRGTTPRSAAEEVYEALCLGTHDYVRKNGFQKVLIGLSGGIDSALVAAVASDALGREDVIAVTMPSTFSSEGTRLDAKRLAKNLRIPMIEIPIERLRGAYTSTLKKHFANMSPGLAEENLQARIRGNLLMALSNKFGYIVLTTGNKSELATGYCTLYGDMAGGFAVIKDVPKTMVYALCKYRNELAGHAVIPKSLINRPPTAELRLNQKDTDSLPPYSVLDPIIEAYVEQNKMLKDIKPRGATRKMVENIVCKIDLNEYKRRQGPIGVKITPLSFGRDRRMPITNRAPR